MTVRGALADIGHFAWRPAYSAQPMAWGKAAALVLLVVLALDIALDFDAKTIAGTATYTLQWKDPSATQLVLDTRALTISKVEGEAAGGQWQPLQYALAANDWNTASSSASRLTVTGTALPAPSRTVPGTPDPSVIASGSVITEDVPTDALAFGRARQELKPGRAAVIRERNLAIKAAKKSGK